MSAILSKLAQVQQALAHDHLDQAKSLCTRLVQAHPNDPGIHAMQSVVLSRLGQYDQAVYYATRATELLPNETDLRLRLGQVLTMARKYTQAVAVLEPIVHESPTLTEGRSSLIGALAGLHRFVDAANVGRAGMPTTDPNLIAFTANALLNASCIEECVKLYREAIFQHPQNLLLLSNFANALNYMPGASRQEVYDAHRAFGRAMEMSTSPLPPLRRDQPDSRPLRVGILSPDLRMHSVAYFIEPWFVHYDRSKFDLHVYSTSPVEDEMTRRLKPLAKVWRTEELSSDLALAQRIRQDKVDVLIELSGHTVGARLGVLSLRPAPVQVTYLGYPHTTGLARVDARIVDSITDAPPTADGWATERLVRLDPCFVCFSPPKNSPEVTAGPATQGWSVTFGSFNTAQKLNLQLIEVWAKLLARVPGSRLVLKATNFADAQLRQELVRKFVNAGVDAARLLCVPPTPTMSDHLATYSQIDIALDPYPYHGTTTTCECLWMGVPVVTLLGESHAARVGASLLAQVGLSDFVASSAGEYVEIAAQLANDVPRLTHLRSTLRERMRTSALCDGLGFSQRFGASLSELFRKDLLT